MTTYFYVSKIGGGKPSYQHPSFASAMAEAKRLIDTVGGEYEVLEARAVVKAAPKYIVQDFQKSAMSAQAMSNNYDHDDSLIPF